MGILVFHAGSSVPPSLPGYTLVPGEWGAISLSTRTYLTLKSRNVVPPIWLVMLRLGANPEEKGERMTRDQLLEDLRWLAEGNPKYAGTNEEGQQNIAVAYLMASDFLLSYINDQEVTGLFNKIRGGYSS